MEASVTELKGSTCSRWNLYSIAAFVEVDGNFHDGLHTSMEACMGVVEASMQVVEVFSMGLHYLLFYADVDGSLPPVDVAGASMGITKLVWDWWKLP